MRCWFCRIASIPGIGCCTMYVCGWVQENRASVLDEVYTSHPDRAPLKEVLGGTVWEDSTITEKGGGKCCGSALKAAKGVEVVDVVRIRAPKK